MINNKKKIKTNGNTDNKVEIKHDNRISKSIIF